MFGMVAWVLWEKLEVLFAALRKAQERSRGGSRRIDH